MKKKLVILLSCGFINVSLASDISVRFVLGTAFSAYVCKNAYSCAGPFYVGNQYVQKDSQSVCVSVASFLSWDGLQYVNYLFHVVDDKKNSAIDVWGASMNPQFSYTNLEKRGSKSSPSPSCD